MTGVAAELSDHEVEFRADRWRRRLEDVVRPGTQEAFMRHRMAPRNATTSATSSAASSPPVPWTDREIAMRQRANAAMLPRPQLGEANEAPSCSDGKLTDDITRRIETRLGSDARDLTVAVNDAAVTIDGPVRTRSTKAVVGAIAEACPGVRAVDNRLRVDWIDETPSAERASSASPPQADADYIGSIEGSPTTTQRRTES
jgi:hypothetical protein